MHLGGVKILIIVQLIVHMILLNFHKKLDFLMYQLLCAFNYLISVSVIQTLDMTFPIYLLFSILPYITKIKFDDLFSLIFLLYYITVYIISTLMNGLWRPTSIFLIRLSGILFFYYIFINTEYKKEYRKFVFVLSLICEFVLTIIAIHLSEDGRLMLNYQCTVGCIATSFVLFLSYDLYKNRSVTSLIIMILHTFIACLSGTRGYILICLGISIASIVLFATPKQKSILFFTSLVVIAFNFNELVNLFNNTLRFGQSTGIRNAENSFVIKFMSKRPIFNILFGNGFGSQTKKFGVSNEIISEVSESIYQFNNLHIKDGFHNFWLTMLYSAGFIGLILIIIMYFNIIKKVTLYNVEPKMKLLLVLYLVLYAILLWYRWSATSGIFEFGVLAFILKQIEYDSKNLKDR